MEVVRQHVEVDLVVPEIEVDTRLRREERVDRMLRTRGKALLDSALRLHVHDEELAVDVHKLAVHDPLAQLLDKNRVNGLLDAGRRSFRLRNWKF